MPYRRTLFFLLLVTLTCSMLVPPGLLNAGEPVRFSWAVLADTPDGVKAVDFSAPTSLACGTTLQIYIEQQPGTYIYLYLLDSAGELSFLFPEKTDYYSTTPPAEKIFRIPAESGRFELVPPGGQERLYLIAAAARLADLEKLTADYLARPEDRAGQAAVLQEMKKLRRQYSKLAQPTETSVPVAGTIRTRGPSAPAFEAVKVNTVEFYSKTLRINHE